MYKFNSGSYDIQLLTAIYQQDWVIGTGWAGNLKNAGFKGEISYFVPYENYFNSENVMSASVSVDYGFKKGLYINSTIYSPTNQSVIIMPSLDYSIATNWELNFTGQSFFEFQDYQTIGNSMFVRLRWSF